MVRSTSTRSDSRFIKEHLGGSPEAYPLRDRDALYQRGAQHAHSGPITTSICNEPTTTTTTTSSSSSSSVLPSGGNDLNPTTSDPIPSSTLPAAQSQSMRPILVVSAPTAMPVVAITCAAIGGAVSVAVICALIYVWRIRRRTKRVKRVMNVLGSGASVSSRVANRGLYLPSCVRAHSFWSRAYYTHVTVVLALVGAIKIYDQLAR